jgi:4-carboxymuconolactone decarboxylase
MATRFDKGLAIRTEVVGRERVERSLMQADDFSRPLQELTTEFAWGDVWGREGLDRRSRSIATIGLLIGLNRSAELKVHINGGLNNGLTRDELRELIMHASVYAGFPAALEAMRLAQEVLSERD